MNCFVFQEERSLLQKNQIYPTSNLSITESSSYTSSYSLNSFSVSSVAADSLSISTAVLSISTAESHTGVASTASVYEKVSEENPGDGQSPKTPKPPPPRLIWTVQLHEKFVDTVAQLGIENAVPKAILQLMDVDGLTLEDVASHLVTYQDYLKRMQRLSKSSGSGGGGTW